MNAIILFFAFGQLDAVAVSQKLLSHFQSVDKVHIRGVFRESIGDPPFISKYAFDFYKRGTSSKYLQKTVELLDGGKPIPPDQFNSFESFTDEFGAYSHSNDPVTGKYMYGFGVLWDGKKSNLGGKTVEINQPLAPLTGNFAFTEVNMPTNPCFSFEELLGISKAELAEGLVGDQKVPLLTLKSAWGLVRIWLDPLLFRPLRVEAERNSKCLQATGVTVEAAQKDKDYKSLVGKVTYSYVYSDKSNANQYPSKVLSKSFSKGILKNEEDIILEQTATYDYELVEPFGKEMQKFLLVSSTAKNGTKFSIDNQPQIAYHLEDGLLVQSANHKFLNQISLTVFGGIGFWQRFFLTLGPLLVTGIMAFWVWHRLRHRIE